MLVGRRGWCRGRKNINEERQEPDGAMGDDLTFHMAAQAVLASAACMQPQSGQLAIVHCQAPMSAASNSARDRRRLF